MWNRETVHPLDCKALGLQDSAFNPIADLRGGYELEYSGCLLGSKRHHHGSAFFGNANATGWLAGAGIGCALGNEVEMCVWYALRSRTGTTRGRRRLERSLGLSFESRSRSKDHELEEGTMSLAD